MLLCAALHVTTADFTGVSLIMPSKSIVAQATAASPGSAQRLDWATLTLDISMWAGWAFLLVLTACVVLDL
jgi:hypothetical protein